MRTKIFAIKINILLCILSINTFGQGTQITTKDKAGEKFLIGSLPKSTSSIYQKLKIEIFGGKWINQDLGTRSYTISTRDGSGVKDEIIINQEQRGGASNYYRLKVYKTDIGHDFVIETTSRYVSFLVQAWLGHSNNWNQITPITAQQITKYNPGNNEDITSQIKVNIISSTDQAGNVGIGTDTPQATLDVRGKIIADEVQIKVNKGADFVFNPGYDLRPLSEVKDFVTENKHLPEIPTEKQMQEEGLNLNEMQIKLLQKIEELTLYTIQLEEKYNQLEKRLNQQEK